jgi:predicted component of type VI protein secretion system
MSHPESPGNKLVVRHTKQVLPLLQTDVTIGRQADNTIVLSDPQVSRHHAVISWQSGTYVITDLGSANGTYVNEKRIAAQRELRRGYVLRMGNTVLDVFLAPAIPPAPASIADSAARMPTVFAPQVAGEASSASSKRLTLPLIAGLLLGGFVVACLITVTALFLLDLWRSEPTVTVQSPKEGAQVVSGNEIILQATATGARNITRLEMRLDGDVVATASSSDPDGQPSLTASRAWTFDQAGSYVISAVAYTTNDRGTDPVSVRLTVVDQAGQVVPSMTPSAQAATALPSATPTPTLPPSATQLPDTPSPTSLPTQTPFPSETPIPTSTDTPTPSPTEPPPPVIDYFWANPDEIASGECTLLEWGLVTNATAASIDQGIGGVATPGSRQVCPADTTTYILTATGPGGSTTASAIVSVSEALPDLIVESITFFPSPPVHSQDNQVQIAIRNIGAGPAGTFDWEWQPGTEPTTSGTVAGGLGAGNATAVTAVWDPSVAYEALSTVARVDPGNAVVESDETNNELEVVVEVVAPEETTVSLMSQADLDGYVVAGQGSDNARGIRVGVASVQDDAQVYRGFMSFDLTSIPSGAAIQSAEFSFFQAEVIGEPYLKLGTLFLKHVDYGATLDTGDFDGAAMDSMLLPSITLPNQWYTVTDSIAGWVESDLTSGRTRLQVRLQFLVEDGGSTSNLVGFESGNNYFGTGNLPRVIITYTP